MSKIHVKTLTSVHIGSGETLQYGTDIVPGKDSEGYGLFGVVDPKKILNLIGEEHIGNWVSAIERKESSKSVIKQFAPHAELKDYSKRILLDYCDKVAKVGDTIKEFIHDGMGKPYIPGSSIKGAIRTAVLATMSCNVKNAEQKINSSKKDRKTGKLKLAANAKKIETSLFGADPNRDVFRFLQVGDAVFGSNYEVVLRMVNINERENASFWDTSKPQMIEALPADDETEFQMKISSDYYMFSKSKWPSNANCTIGNLPSEMQTLTSLFCTINDHTRHLVEEEIGYWEEREDKDDTEMVSDYIGKMNDILSAINGCKKGRECVLRIGHGSGWRFVTGAWAENLDNFESLVIPVSRPYNVKYTQYDFPKTRRVDEQCELLGFVKLTIKE